MLEQEDEDCEIDYYVINKLDEEELVDEIMESSSDSEDSNREDQDRYDYPDEEDE